MNLYFRHVGAIMKISEAQKVNEIPVVFAIDKKYVPIFSTCLASILEHINSRDIYKLIVLSDDIPDQMIDSLQIQIKYYNNVNLQVINMNCIKVKNSINFINFPKSAIYRLYVPKLFPQYKKIIYLDSDIIVMSDIAELYFSLENEFAAAVIDYGINGYIETESFYNIWVDKYCNARFYYIKYCGIEEQNLYKYFNSGVLVLNLDKIRRNNVDKQCLELIFNKKFAYPDQDVLNILFKGDIKILPQEWNFIPCKNNDLKFNKFLVEQYNSALSKIKIIHFAGNKPWTCHNKVQFEEYFWFYARKSMYYEEIIKHKNKILNIKNLIAIKIKETLKASSLFSVCKKYFPLTYLKIKNIYKKI